MDPGTGCILSWTLWYLHSTGIEAKQHRRLRYNSALLCPNSHFNSYNILMLYIKIGPDKLQSMKCLCKRRGQDIQNLKKKLKKGEENNKNTEDQRVKKSNQSETKNGQKQRHLNNFHR